MLELCDLVGDKSAGLSVLFVYMKILPLAAAGVRAYPGPFQLLSFLVTHQHSRSSRTFTAQPGFLRDDGFYDNGSRRLM